MKTVSERRAELSAMKFVDVRNLVHLMYKKPDNSPLMTHSESLGTPRDTLKDIVIQYEVEKGMIVPDGAEGSMPVQPPPPPPQMEPVPQMTQQPFQPPQLVPTQSVPPVMPPQQMMAPPQEQPAPAQPPGRRRRGAGSTAAAPPPPAPDPTFMLPQQPQNVQVGVPVVPTQTAGAPAFTPFQPAMPAPQQPAFPQPQAAPAAVDLTPVLQEIQNLGKGLNALGQATGKDMQEIKTTLTLVLTALHHLYLSNPGTAPTTNGQANTLPEFRNFLAKFAGNP